MPSQPPPRRVLLVVNDRVGVRMAGPAIRYVSFARELADEFDVTLVVPNETDLLIDGVGLHVSPELHPADLIRLAGEHDVLVAQHLHLRAMRAVADLPIRAIYDLYDPFPVENLPFYAGQGNSPLRALEYRRDVTIQEAALAWGDALVCASDRQRDLWLGVLAALGRLDVAAYEHDPTLRSLIDVVPFGLDAEPPRKTRPALKGVVPGIGLDDRLLVWGGGIWNWLDAQLVIRAVARLAERRDDVRLYFLGSADPNPLRERSRAVDDALGLAGELGVLDRAVFFNPGWVPWTERQEYLLEADLGVSAHHDTVETRFAFRTRLLDYFWARLPVVTTGGDVLGDLVGERGAGRVVRPGDLDGWVEAIAGLLDDSDAHAAARRGAAALAEELAWPRAVEPLRRLLREAGEAAAPQRAEHRLYARYQVLRARRALAVHGVAGVGRLVAERLRSRP
jgi:glycosyltransferase involved in cell wall biosynthesis